MIEELIHEIISNRCDIAAVDLSMDLLGNRIVTGNVQSHDMQLPYATINRESNQTEFRTNKNRVLKPNIRVKIWHDSHSEGLKIQNAFIVLFENKKFKTPQINVLCFQHENDFAVQETDGTWQFVIDFEAKTQQGKPKCQ